MGSQAADEAMGRQNVYRFLAVLYTRPPTEGLVRQVCNRNFLSDLTAVFGARHTHWLKDFSRSFDGDHEKLRLDYHALFKAPAGSYVTPYESVYMDAPPEGEGAGRGLLMGPSSRKVKAFYAEAGFRLSKEARELADFLGHELDFMSRLCEEEARAGAAKDPELVSSCRRVELKFLEQHLGRWMGVVAGRIQENAGTDFYKGVAEITRAFVKRDLKGLRKASGRQARSA